MSKLLVIICIISSVAFQHCTDDPELFVLDRQFKIKQEETIIINQQDSAVYLEVQAVSISDSRCPADASCVRYGEAEVKLSITGLQEIATEVNLCIGDCPQRNQGFIETDTVDITIDNVDYSVILLDVEPYPTTVNQSVPKEALVKVVSR